MKLIGAMFISLFLLAACQQETVRPTKDSAAEIDNWMSGQGDATGKPAPPQPAKPKGPVVRAREDGPAWDWSDPDVENLQELEGLLLLYYQQHHELPPALSELKGKALDGEAVSLTCPTDGKPYVYKREGLTPPQDIVPKSKDDRGSDPVILYLIVYDAEPTHEITQHLTDGTKDWDEKKMVRYGIVMKPPGKDGSLTLQVVPVEQALLDAYMRQTHLEAGKPQLTPVTPVRRPDSGGLW